MSWWHDAVIYQVYPRSFQDSDGDGVGDLAGIEQRLDHIAGLGAAALWLSPIYPSPLADFGYDVSDFRDVDPRVRHARRLRRGSSPPRTSAGSGCCSTWCRATPRSSTRGSPTTRTGTSGPTAAGRAAEQLERPTSAGSAWTRDPASGRWYLHSFYPEQPDLDWRNPEVVRGDAGRGPLLAGPRRRRLPDRRDRPAAQGPRSCATIRRPRVRSRCRCTRTRARSSASTRPTARTSREAVGALREAAGDALAGGRGLPAGGAGRALPRAPRRRFAFELFHAPWDAAALRAAIATSAALERTTGGRGGVGAVEPRLPAAAHAGRPGERPRGGGPAAHPARARLRLPGRGDRPGRRPRRRARLRPRAAATPTAIRSSGSPTPGPAASPTGEPWLPPVDPEDATCAVQSGRPGSLLELYRDLIALRPRLEGRSRAARGRRRTWWRFDAATTSWP